MARALNFWLAEDGQSTPETWDPPVEYIEPYKEPADKSHPLAWYDRRSVLAQDHMAWETQGSITDRSVEHLSYSDRGVVLLRRAMFEQMDRVARGEDPLGVIRDPNHPLVDTQHRRGCLAEAAHPPLGRSPSVGD